jgi:epoxyqueuosine reductase
MNSSEQTMWIKNKALESGFLAVGIARAGKLEGVENQLVEWLDKGYHGDMAYMENHRQQRVDPTVLVPGSRSVISLAYNYFTPALQKPGSPKISTYAYGKDYHKVLKKKLKTLWNSIKEEVAPGAQGRYFVDSAPVMERQWAAEAGLGWQGKNTLLIHPRAGSYFFLAEIICDLELDYDEPIPDHCGTCRRCIDACPTDAIAPEGYLVKANQCLSYLTIETKKDIPGEFSSKMEDWVFGCDICQQVCPWNRFSVPHSEPLFTPSQEFLGWSPGQWKDLNEQQFETNFAHTPVKRAGFEKLTKSIGHCLPSGEVSEEV